jgi:N-acetylmuramoyl-L-alanine amidase
MAYKEVNKYLTGKALTGQKLKKTKGIVIHWFADPMAKAENVINWWQRQADGVSAHDVICLDGTLYHAVPYDQMAYQVGCKRGYTKDAVSRLSAYPNDCVIGVECAHLDWDGTMTPATYNTLVQHTAKLVKQEKLGLDDIWLHSQIVGKDYKDCHRWFTTTKPLIGINS